ncbi:alkaline phosphatase family protein [Geoglobus ahangari]
MSNGQVDSVKRVFVIGLDSAPPELLFNRFLEDMPNVRRLLGRSLYGPMKSCIPAITIPAWMVMNTGKTPGELGLYGFRHRKKGTYNDIWIAHSLMVKEKAVWDHLGENGKKSIVVGVPPSYPPKKINGCMIGCFITPDANSDYTYPDSLKGEIERLVGEYIFDVVFRKDERDEVKEKLWEMTEKRFEVIRYLIENKEWDFFEFVEIGLDRVHHAFWKYFDETHHLHEPDSKYKNVIRDYYRLLDKEIEMTLKLLDMDETAVMIVSDHGVKAMKGAFAINQWLIEEGLLKVKSKEIEAGSKLERLDVDWKNSTAWAWGGYYSRIFINVEGREPEGKIGAERFYEVRDEIAELVRSIRGPNGERWDTKVYYPEDIYPVAKGDKPDMMVYLDNLNWRAAGTLGYESPYLEENDTGPDDAVHSEHGVFSIYIPGMESSRQLITEIYDFAPTVLKLFGIEKGLRGNSVV